MDGGKGCEATGTARTGAVPRWSSGRCRKRRGLGVWSVDKEGAGVAWDETVGRGGSQCTRASGAMPTI